MKHFFNSHEPDIITKLVYVLFVFNKHFSLCFDWAKAIKVLVGGYMGRKKHLRKTDKLISTHWTPPPPLYLLSPSTYPPYPPSRSMPCQFYLANFLKHPNCTIILFIMRQNGCTLVSQPNLWSALKTVPGTCSVVVRESNSLFGILTTWYQFLHRSGGNTAPCPQLPHLWKMIPRL